MSKLPNPYTKLGNSNFWKTAVYSREPGETFENLWIPKFSITKDDRILTAGSCFAQHISKWLKESGYNWFEAEIPSENANEQLKREMGYGIFSFRTGNIYTPSLLRQWIEQAEGLTQEIDEIYKWNGKFIDPLRPNIPASGYTSIEELLNDRKRTHYSISNGLRKSDIFIFTLGLTEAWKHQSGYVYPICPGTINGTFDPENHFFINYEYNQIVKDMCWIIEHIKSINSKIKFLLTVSPVPLTATATDDHVLSATTYSKSVLRAAAGDLVKRYNFVDYFPSYELITSYATKINYFEENLRSVKPDGVSYVMKHFANGLNIGNKKSKSKHFSIIQDEVCEEILLESWRENIHSKDSANICLLGDSHMGLLSMSLKDLKIPHQGGMIMNGSSWVLNKFSLDDEEYLVPLEDSGSRDRWSKTLNFFEEPSDNKTIITNIGMQTHMSVGQILQIAKQRNYARLDKENFKQLYLTINKKKLELIKRFLILGYNVMVISDPPTRFLNKKIAKNIKIWNIYDKFSLEIFGELGCITINAATLLKTNDDYTIYRSDRKDSDGNLDWIHGNPHYYSELAELLLEKMGFNRPIQ